MTGASTRRLARPALPAFTPTALSGAELDARTVGRDALIERILDSLRTTATSRNRPHQLIVGPRGSGKTHALAVVLHRAASDARIARRLAFAWIPEDAVGVSSYDDLLIAIVEHLLDDAPGEQQSKQATLDQARLHRRTRDTQSLEDLVRDMLGGRVLVLVLENLDRIFGELGETGQARLRGFMETSGDLLVLASTPLLFDAVSERDRPWFGSFAVEHLDELSVEDGSVLLERIAAESNDDELARFLTTDAARQRMRAVSRLAGGSPRMWMVCAGCMTIELLEDLVPLVEAMLDQLAPYYQQRLWELPPIERKLVAELCRTATLNREGRVVHEQQGMRTVTDLATVCGIDQRVAATALGRLLTARWVKRSKPSGTDQRTTRYEVREPLLRHHMQYRETRGEPLRVIVGFLRAWYAPIERVRELAAAEAGSLAEQYLSSTLSSERRGSDWLWDAASVDELISGARCLLDEGARDAGSGLRSAAAGIVAEAVALDAWRGRPEALRAARSRLPAIAAGKRRALARVVAASLSVGGTPVSEFALLDVDVVPPTIEDAGPETPRSLPAAQSSIARALIEAVEAADDEMCPRDRVAIQLLAAGWMGRCGDTRRACALLERAHRHAAALAGDDPDLRLAVDAELAYFRFESGRREEGLALCERVLEGRIAALGDDHPDTLRSRTNHAYFVGLSGDSPTARELFRELASDAERILGAEHEETLTIRGHHANWVGCAGDHAGARDLHAEVVRDREQVLGPDHPRALSSRYAHASFVSSSSGHRVARDLFASLVEDRDRVLGSDHRDTLATRYAYAFCLGASGGKDREAARDLLAAVADDQARVLGADDPSTFQSRRMHASYLARTLDPEGASLVALDIYVRARRIGAHDWAMVAEGLMRTAAGRRGRAGSMLLGEWPRLKVAAEAALRVDATVAGVLLPAWCVATVEVEDAQLSDAIQRLVDLAAGGGRVSELGAGVLRALPRVWPSRRASWIAGWLSAAGTHEDFAAVRRMLIAAEAALDGDSAALLALPPEEQGIVEEVVTAAH